MAFSFSLTSPENDTEKGDVDQYENTDLNCRVRDAPDSSNHNAAHHHAEYEEVMDNQPSGERLTPNQTNIVSYSDEYENAGMTGASRGEPSYEDLGERPVQAPNVYDRVRVD